MKAYKGKMGSLLKYNKGQMRGLTLMHTFTRGSTNADGAHFGTVFTLVLGFPRLVVVGTALLDGWHGLVPICQRSTWKPFCIQIRNYFKSLFVRDRDNFLPSLVERFKPMYKLETHF
jgi:hypothetical protein